VLRSQVAIIFLVFCQNISALPIDWHGVLGFDTNIIDNYRRLEGNTFAGNSDGTQEIPLPAGNEESANWQSYIFRLQPNIVINDSATIKAELSSGYARGGFAGSNSTQSQQSGLGNQLYPLNFSDGGDSLIVNQLYTELYSDTATYVIGRQSQHFGLGAVIDSGEDTWDRFFYLRDGLTIKVKLGNFKIEPYWTRVGAGSSLTKGTRIKDYGISLVYDSIERDMAFGILYNKKQTTQDNSFQTNVGSASTQSLGATDVKMTDLYFKKAFGDFDFAVEVPILSGEIGNVYTANTKYKAQAIVLEANLKASNSWSFGLRAGKVNGDDGNSSSFEAMYLNPNYQIANLLFRYNLGAISNSANGNVYDSYINNATYAKVSAHYQTEKWKWDMAAIWAKADQVAKAGGQPAYNHLRNETYNSNFAQEDDLGLEIDSGFEYRWNSEITIGGSAGYLLTGDYFGYNNTATPNEIGNTYILQLRTAITF